MHPLRLQDAAHATTARKTSEERLLPMNAVKWAIASLAFTASLFSQAPTNGLSFAPTLIGTAEITVSFWAKNPGPTPSANRAPSPKSISRKMPSHPQTSAATPRRPGRKTNKTRQAPFFSPALGNKVRPSPKDLADDTGCGTFPKNSRLFLCIYSRS